MSAPTAIDIASNTDAKSAAVESSAASSSSTAVPPASTTADDDDDDAPVALSAELLEMLSPEARAALSAHLSAKAAATAATAAAAASSTSADGAIEIGEDFGMSQFWYTDECADEMARIITAAALARLPSTAPADTKVRIACISAPSAYKALKRAAHPRVLPFVLEYDKRFALYGKEFVYYDFNSPSTIKSTYSDEELGGALKKSFDGIIADPPYLNEDCMRKTSETIRLLAKTSLLSGSPTPLMFNTGAILTKPIALVLNAKPCKKHPRHRVAIMNPFTSFTNFECPELDGWEEE